MAEPISVDVTVRHLHSSEDCMPVLVAAQPLPGAPPRIYDVRYHAEGLIAEMGVQLEVGRRYRITIEELPDSAPVACRGALGAR